MKTIALLLAVAALVGCGGPAVERVVECSGVLAPGFEAGVTAYKNADGSTDLTCYVAAGGERWESTAERPAGLEASCEVRFPDARWVFEGTHQFVQYVTATDGSTAGSPTTRLACTTTLVK